MSFRVDVASMGRMDLPGPEVFWMSDWDEWFTATFWMVVARSEAYVVVINTGPPAEMDDLNELWRGFHPSGRCEFKREEAERPEAALARLGIKPEDVTHVVLSPTVVYTAGNLRLFPNATFVLSRRGWIEDVMAPPYPPHLPRHIFVPDDILSFLLFEARDRVLLIDEGEVVPGVTVWPALVHHRSSLAVCFDTDKGSVIATDAAFSYRNVEENINLGIGESYAEAMATYARLRREADVLIPLYESKVLDRHPDGHIA